MLTPLVQHPRALGLSLTTYDPALDPDRSCARRLVNMLEALLGAGPVALMEMLIVCTAIACAAMGGVFFAFSSFVMRALARMPPAQGIAAMQSIDIVAVTPVFMTALFGTAAACVVVGGRRRHRLARRQERRTCSPVVCRI